MRVSRLILPLLLCLLVLHISYAAAQTTGSTKLAVLSIEPKDGSFQVGETISATVTLDTKAQQTDLADLVITYDPTLLQVVDQDSTKDGVQIADGDLYEITLANDVDTTKGTITYSRTSLTPSTYYTTADGAPAGALAKISFKTLAAGKADVNFKIAESGQPAATRVVSINDDVLKTTNNASYTITTAQTPPATTGTDPSTIVMNANVSTLTADGVSEANITLSVLDSQGSSKANVPVTVTLSQGDATLTPSGTVTDANGQITATLKASTTAGAQTITASLTNNPSVTNTLSITQEAPSLGSAPTTTPPPAAEQPATQSAPQQLSGSGPENMNVLFSLMGIIVLGGLAHVRKEKFPIR